MVCNVKMEVTPDLSERVQEIVFENSGSWDPINLSTNINNTEYKYLFINKNKFLICSNKKEILKDDGFKEISAYDFIVSRGKLEWLPKYGEKALFSNNGEKWAEDVFMFYSPTYDFPYETQITNYKYCKSLSKAVSFIQFLKDNNAYEKYMENSKIENQRWSVIGHYIKPNKIKETSKYKWIFGAFSWFNTKEREDFWEDLNNKWITICDDNKDVVWDD